MNREYVFEGKENGDLLVIGARPVSGGGIRFSSSSGESLGLQEGSQIVGISEKL